jgi:hypothetical protein
MHVKFLAHSTGSGRAAVNYLMGERDHQGEMRAGVEVLRGDPKQVGQLIDSLKSVHRYTSGVIAFHKDDAPTDAEIQTVLTEFERVAFAGLEPDQYTWSAVLHEESDGSKHIHVIVPRVELTTGRAFNVAPPGWQKTFDPLRDALNYSHGWARPDDPRLSRQVQPGRVAQWAGWKAGEDPRQQLTDWLTSQVLAGVVNDRQDVLAALGSIGEINRQGRDYISIRVEDGAKPIRLKGAIYDQKFDGRALREAATAAAGRPGGREAPDLRAAEAARARLAKALSSRARYNEERYPAPERSHGADARRDVAAPAVVDAVAAVDQREPVVGDRAGGDRVGLVESEQGGRPGRSKAAPNTPTGDQLLPNASGPDSLQSEVIDDRTRTLAHRAIEQAQRSARAAIQAVERAARAASEAYRCTVSACRAVDAAALRVRLKMSDEIERFKSEISLVDYAQAEHGYELIEKESSKASKVLKAGGDKIIVTRQDGHDVYFSTGDAADSGSVIDFIQRRVKLNLGQVRKALRPWLPGAKRPAIKRPARAPDHAVAVTKDRAGVLARWAAMQPYAGTYLTRERGIDKRVIEAFEVRQDERGNACFGHRDYVDVSGWEVKNQGFTGFSAGGERAVTLVVPGGGKPKKIVICESAIDAMSYAQLKHERGNCYMSTAGAQLSPAQRTLLTQILSKTTLPVVLAMDKDAAGERMAQEVAQMAPQGVQTTREVPEAGKDWNDALRAQQAAMAAAEERAMEQEQQRGLRM